MKIYPSILYQKSMELAYDNNINQQEMVKKPLLLALITSGVWFTSSAHASGDWDCGSNFSLDNRTYNECKYNFPTLDTGNDTQTNLYLLLADMGLLKFDPTKKVTEPDWYAYEYPLALSDLQQTAVNVVKNPKQNFLEKDEKNYEAEYCNSVSLGKDELAKALKLDSNLTANERQQLLAFRQHISNHCTSEEDKKTTDTAPDLPQIWSKNAQPYADYIMATQLFYAGDKASFDTADSLYRPLTTLKTNGNAGLTWLVDTANYMLIRTGINRIYQHGMGEYSYEVAKADLTLVASTQQAIDSYQNANNQNMSKGRYLASARGLQRRLYWLTGQQDKLIGEIEWQIHHPDSPLFNLDSRVLPEEIERKIFFADTDHPLDINKLHDPILITSFALSRLRPAKPDDEPKPLTLAELEQLKPKFAIHPELYQYLLANFYFVQQNNPKQALQYLPTDTPKDKLSYFTLSQYALKARALEAMGQNNEAVTLWKNLQPLAKHEPS